MKFIWLMIFCLLSGAVNATTLHVGFISPIKQNDPFWQLVTDIAKAVAEDLNIKLDIRAVDIDRFSTLSAIQSLSDDSIKPDYVIYRPLQGNSLEIVKILESSKIPFVTLENGFSDAELKIIGQPQQKFKYWLGEVTYDNKSGGALLASTLYRHYLKKNPNKTMHITGIGGGLEQIAFKREAGLEEVASQHDNVEIDQIFPMFWLVNNLKQRFPAIYQRYPNTNAFWCAADAYSLSILEQLKQLGSTSNPHVLIGGFDWLPEAIEKIQTGEITASVGGHMLMAAKALLKIVDYHNGNNVFLNDKESEKYEIIDLENVALYLPFLKKAPWPEIDFRQFSNGYHQQQKPVDFTMENLLKAYSELNLLTSLSLATTAKK